MRKLDLPALILAWVLAAIGIGTIAGAAAACHSSPRAASVLLATAGIVTTQLLALAIHCYCYRLWTASPISEPTIDPTQHKKAVRRGVPALTSTSSRFGGVDGWSCVVIFLLLLPIPFPALSLYRASAELRSSSRTETPKEPTFHSTTASEYGGMYYTVAAFESIKMAYEARITSKEGIQMSNTADVVHVPEDRMVMVPSRVPSACLYDRVGAMNLTAIVGQYTCKFDNDRNQAVSAKDSVNVTTKVLSVVAPVEQQLTVQHSNLKVVCSVKFYETSVSQVTWHGKDEKANRNCRLAALSDRISQEDLKPLATIGLNEDMNSLQLSLRNCFAHAVNYDGVRENSNEEKAKLYGGIFAAAVIIRSIDPRDEQWKNKPVVQVTFTPEVCYQYSWGGLTIFLITVDIILAAFTSVLCVGFGVEQLLDIVNCLAGTLRQKDARQQQRQPDVASSAVSLPTGATSQTTSVRHESYSNHPQTALAGHTVMTRPSSALPVESPTWQGPTGPTHTVVIPQPAVIAGYMNNSPAGAGLSPATIVESYPAAMHGPMNQYQRNSVEAFSAAATRPTLQGLGNPDKSVLPQYHSHNTDSETATNASSDR